MEGTESKLDGGATKMDPPEPTGGQKAMPRAPLRGAEEADRQRRFCRLKDELDRQQWTVSFNLLALALMAVKNALWRSTHMSDRKALWSEVVVWVMEKLLFREPPLENEIQEKLLPGGETHYGRTIPHLLEALRTLSAVLKDLFARNPPLSAAPRLSDGPWLWSLLPPQQELECASCPPAEDDLQERLDLCEELCAFRKKAYEELRDGVLGDPSDLYQELEGLTQRFKLQTREVLARTKGVLTGTRGVLDKVDSATEAPERTPKTHGNSASEEQISLSIDGERGAESRCDHPSFLQASHTPPSVPSSRTDTLNCREDWMPRLNKYFWSDVETTWDISSRLCLENGGRLAVLHDELKMDEIFKEFGRRYPWIGLSKSEEEFQWIDGFRFNENMTPVYGFGECAYLRKDGIFLNECSMRRSSLCMKEPLD
ncbi:uncharacterized protein [Pleurodeles waltl]|uniref:uncharacterized protein isoform X2 n=1 Tax=Pleurodeles waltl TaxID=8319 RepID=UPI0037098ACB